MGVETKVVGLAFCPLYYRMKYAVNTLNAAETVDRSVRLVVQPLALNVDVGVVFAKDESKGCHDISRFVDTDVALLLQDVVLYVLARRIAVDPLNEIAATAHLLAGDVVDGLYDIDVLWLAMSNGNHGALFVYAVA